MKSLAISAFKARCLRILDEVSRTGEPLVITRRGQPIARVLPMQSADGGKWLGSLEGTAEVLGDIVEPVSSPKEWEALRE